MNHFYTVFGKFCWALSSSGSMWMNAIHSTSCPQPPGYSCHAFQKGGGQSAAYCVTSSGNGLQNSRETVASQWYRQKQIQHVADYSGTMLDFLGMQVCSLKITHKDMGGRRILFFTWEGHSSLMAKGAMDKEGPGSSRYSSMSSAFNLTFSI